MPVTRDVTVSRAWRVLLPGLPSSLGGVCVQPSHGSALRYRHGASASGKPGQHSPLSRMFAPGMPVEPGQTQATGCPLHTAGALALLPGLPGWQRSHHPSFVHGPSWHELKVPAWDSAFPRPPVLPSAGHLSGAHPCAPQGALEQPDSMHKTSPPVTPLSPKQSLPLTAGLNIM